jgi:serine/threonine protein kinase
VDPDQHPLPTRIGRYHVSSELGRGMMGVVYKADDSVMGRTVALKVIRLVFPVTPEQREAFEQRFVAEARIIARLSHPNIVVAYDVGRDGERGSPYMALEYLVGRTLSQALQQGPALDWQAALRVTSRVAEALHYAHAQGVVHRDVKPANIMLLESGEPKLMDFGLAKLHAGFELTASGQFMGTPLYMSPEQATGVAVDGRSDLFSLGSVLYTLLTGTRAFDAESVPRIVNRVAYDQPLPPTRLAKSLPAALDYVLARALAKPPEARYQDGRSLAEDLEDVLAARAPRHRGNWAPPRAGELTMSSAATDTSRAAPAEHEGSRGAAQRALLGRDEITTPGASVRRRRSGALLPLLVLSMLAFGLVLFSSPFWREYLARSLALLPESTRPAAPGAAPSASPESVPAAAEATVALAETAASPEQGTSELPAEALPEPTPSTSVEEPAADPSPSTPPIPIAVVSAAPSPAPPEAGATQSSPTPPLRGAHESPGSSAAPAAAPRPSAPAPRPASESRRTAVAPPPASAKDKAKATARLSISLTHDLKSGRLKVDVDGETVCDQTLRAKQKPYLLLLKRRESSLDRTLPVVPGQRRLTLEVRSGQRKETKELVERFKAGETRHFDLRVTSGDNGFRFEWQ